MKLERPRFELTRVYADGTSEAPEIFPVGCIPPQTEMSRRGILGIGVGAAALLFLLDGHTEGAQRRVVRPELSGPGQTTKLLKAPDKPPLAHTDEVRALILSPDGKVLISGSEDNTVKLWSMPEGQWLNTLHVHPADVAQLALTPDGKTLVTMSAETLRLWSIPEGQLRKVLDGHVDVVNTTAISSDSKLLISGSQDQTIKVWSLLEGELLTTLQGHGPIQSLALSPDGKMLATGGKETDLRVWSLPEGRLRMKLSRYRVAGFSITPAGHLLTVSSSEMELRSLTDGRLLKEIKSNGRIRDVAVSLDGKQVVSVSSESLSIWSLPEGKLVHRVENSLYDAGRLILSPDNRMLLSGGGYEPPRLWSLPDGELLAELKTDSRTISARVSTTSQQLVTGETGGGIALWSLQPRGFSRYLSDPALSTSKRPDTELKAHTTKVSALAVSNDGKLLVSASHDDTAKIWSLPTGQLLATFDGHEEDINDVVITTDGTTFITASDDRTIKLWRLPDAIQPAPPPAQRSKQAARTPARGRLAKARLIATLQGHAGTVSKLFLGVDNQTLVSTDSEHVTKIWSLPDRRLLSTLPDPTKKLRVMAITANAKFLVTTTNAREDDALQLWPLPEAQVPTTLGGHAGQIKAVAVTSDSKLLAAATDNNSIRLWDLSNGHLLGLLEGPDCTSLAFSPDNKLLAGSSGNSISLWSMRDSRLLATLEEHRGEGYGRDEKTVIFAPNGQLLISTATNGGIRLWSLPEGRLVATFEARMLDSDALTITPDSKILACGDYFGSVALWNLEKPGFHSFLFDPAANTSDIKGISYNTYDKTTGQVVTYTLPCGSAVPAGAVCTCNCVAGTERAYRPPSGGGGGGGGGGTYCSCNRVCTCIPVPSDRNAKEAFESTDALLILQRLSELPIQKWNYKWDDTSVRHIGPMAQDFATAFGVGEDDKHIHPGDAQGVAFAAIQALYKIAKESEEQTQRLRTQLLRQQEKNEALNARVEVLERLSSTHEYSTSQSVYREQSV